MEGREGQTSLGEIQIEEDHWGPGSEPIVRTWLAEHYDPDTMPRLIVGNVEGREGVWLLGWSNEDTPFPGLLATIFGDEYARAQLDRIDALIQEARNIPPGSFGQGRL